MATLAANLASLYSIAERQLPNLAEQFATARTKLDTIGDASVAFYRNDGLGSGPTGCHPELQALTDIIVAFLLITANNLDDTAAAVRACAKSYAHQDAATAAEFKKQTGVI